ncbi:Pre-mRNA-splicing factor of RES complex-domain-containing protein [Cokeromyces recurvatus]|uniref:Pre-mRNA-splicing factor of RES complex-domain-containing protein n=1 Tax=Cokeromyces recurvatus TaxID=90255 RepID=UPI002220B543|nr:Pre-mRNA-splicing factor of RES complex-domain-containing protein [Cokeromyces recurvatus]KAI7906671.1 Pre-mRNA-splicing factor of RES complex-domain-containing protein [Cokeromyces recurvatus]
MDQLNHEEVLKRKYLARNPGDAATKAYIASKYLDTSEKPKKKKKKSKKASYQGIGIIDDEEDISWKSQPQEPEPDDDDDYKVVEKDVKTEIVNNWEIIREGSEETEDERPVVVEEKTERSIPRMSNGQRAGILTKEEIKREAERARLAEQRALEALKESEAKTVYRDTSGRKVDIKRKRAEELKARQEKIEREARKMEWGKGLVQRKEAEEEKRRLEEEKYKPLARYADDEDLNNELKEKIRWNDPAAGFLTNESGKKSEGKKLVKPTYKGPWKPNRFMIPPGYRWDGVDRSTGFEDHFLLQQNQAKSRAVEAYSWSTEDM